MSQGILVANNNAVEINTVGLPAVNLDVLENNNITFVFEQWNGAAWTALSAINLVTGVTETGGAGVDGMWTAAIGATITKARIRCSVAGAAPHAQAALALPTPITPSILLPTSQLVQRSIVWRPGGVAGPGVVTTWAGVMAFIAESSAPATIWLDGQGAVAGTLTVPAGVWDVKHATFQTFDIGTSFSDNVLAISDNATIKNALAFRGSMKIDAQSSTVGVPALDWDAPSAPFFNAVSVTFDGTVRVTVSGTQPAIISDPAKLYTLQVSFLNGAFFSQTGVVATKFISVLAAGRLGLKFFQAGGGTAWFPFLAGGADATSLLTVTSDGLANFATPSAAWPGFTLGSITYNSPKGCVMSTADRAAIVITKSVGDWYMDTTAAKPGYWTGAAWVDGAGVAIP